MKHATYDFMTRVKINSHTHPQSLSLGLNLQSSSWFSLQSSWFLRLHSLVYFIKSFSNSWC